jgi:lipid II:glycine glycyltransferase (peptidoglycan interpeptide bridge formation enzyme)
VLKKFKKGDADCTTYQQGNKRFTKCLRKVTKTTVNSNTTRVLRRFKRGDQTCTTYQQGNKRFTKCVKTITRRRGIVLRRFRYGRNVCATYKDGNVTYNVCSEEPELPSGATLIKRFQREDQSCL